MKKIIELTILADDIRLDNFLNADECPVTRALARAGHKEYKECGGEIRRSRDYSTVSAEFEWHPNYCEGYKKMKETLFGMYETLNGKSSGTYAHVQAIPIEDFTAVLNFTM